MALKKNIPFNKNQSDVYDMEHFLAQTDYFLQKIQV